MSHPKEEGMMTTTINTVTRIPERVPPKGLSEGVFTDKINKIVPLLYKIAATIARPSYIDDDDLVQEACIHLYRNRHNFDGSIASINTWCVTVARRRFLNIAKRGFGPTRHPLNANGELQQFRTLSGASEIVPSKDQNPFDIASFSQTIEVIKKQLKPFPLKVFTLYMEAPDDFMEFLESKGATENGSIHFITNDHLVEYLGVSYGKLMQAKKEIKQVIKKAIYG